MEEMDDDTFRDECPDSTPPWPEPPVLPEWRETPEREAYWRELRERTSFATGKWKVWLLAFLPAAALELYFKPRIRIWTGLTFMFYLLFRLAWYMYWRIYLMFECRTAPLCRRDISPAIARIMKKRPKFDEAEFAKYWPEPELAATALRILELARESWRPVGRMLYPNDPLPLFFYGSTGRLRRPRMIEPPPEFLENLDLEFAYSQEDGPRLDMDFSFADLVVICHEELRELEATAEYYDRELSSDSI